MPTIIDLSKSWVYGFGYFGGPGILKVPACCGAFVGMRRLRRRHFQDIRGQEPSVPAGRLPSGGFQKGYIQRLQCSSFLMIAYFSLRDYNILPKKELLLSLWYMA